MTHMMKQEALHQAATLLRNSGGVLIFTHRRPDGDTIGCAGALCRALREACRRAYVFPNPEVTPRYAPLIAGLEPPPGFEPGLLVTVDVADKNMLPDNAAKYADSIDLVIDHHRSNPGFGRKYNLVWPEAGACAEIVTDLVHSVGVHRIEPDIAEPLYVGISTDTGCFKYSNTTTDTHYAAAECLASGLDCGELNRKLFEVKSWARLQMEQIMIQTMEFYHDRKIALATILLSDRERVGATEDDLDSISALPRMVEGVQAGLTLTENPNGSVRVSVRTTKEIDASAICRKCGGGGHLRAGGASFPKGVGVEEAKRRILAAAEEVYHESGV